MLANLMQIGISPHEVIGFIDIGSSQITIVAGKINLDEGSFDIIRQLKRGFLPLLQDDHIPYDTLVLMMDEIESSIGRSIEKVVMSINAKHVQSIALSISNQFNSPSKINPFAMRDLLHKAISYYGKVASNKVILDLDFQHYILDRMIKMLDPLDTIASHITAKINIIVAGRETLDRLNHHMSSCRVNVVHYIPTSEAAALAYMHSHELYNPTLLLHIGASSTDMILYHDGNVQYIGHIASAGRAITQDIAKEFAISLQDAERLKTKLGSIYLADNTIIDTSEILESAPYNTRDIRAHAVIKIVKRRLGDIIVGMREKFESQTKRKIGELAGIVLTGGVSKTIDIDVLFRTTLGINCRIGVHNSKYVVDDIEIDPVLIGMMLYLIRQHKQMALYRAHSGGFRNYCYKLACFLERMFS